MRRIVVMFHRFGPYHISRLNSAAQYLDLYGLELSGVDRVYAWEGTDGQEGFPRRVLSPDIEREPSRTLVRRTGEILSAWNPEVVAIPGWSHRGALAALLWCHRARVPVILMSDSTRLDAPRRAWRETLKSRVISLCDSAFVGGSPHRDYLAELGMPRGNITVGYDIVDNDHFGRGADLARAQEAEQRRKLNLPGRYFLASCRFVEKKNLPRLIEAFRDYRHAVDSDAWDLVLLGDGPLRADLAEQVRRERLGSAVHMPGFVQYDALPVYYGLANAFIHPSTTEQWGLVVNEAMAAGLPVIVSNRCGCVEDLVDPEANGYTFDPFDTAGLCRAMVTVAAATEADRQRSAQHGRAMIAEWGPERFATGLREAAELAVAAKQNKSVGDRLLVRLLVNLSGA